MKVVLLDSQVIAGYPYTVEQKIVEDAGFEFVKLSCTNEDEIIKHAKDADAILNIAQKMTTKSINALEKCQIMVRYGIGVDEFDIPAATAKGIKIANVTTYCLEEVALHTVSLLLATTRQLKHFDKTVAKGKWNGDLGGSMRRPSTQLVGILGFGNIAKRVARMLKGIGYQVAAYDPYVSNDVFDELGVVKMELDQIMSEANILTLNLPVTPETKEIINKENIAKMKDGVVIVNASRGELINESDLVDALDAGKIFAVGLDLLNDEPMRDINHPLLNRNNVILTPHIAYRTQEAAMELFAMVAQTAVKSLKGENLPNVLNKKELGL